MTYFDILNGRVDSDMSSSYVAFFLHNINDVLTKFRIIGNQSYISGKHRNFLFWKHRYIKIEKENILRLLLYLMQFFNCKYFPLSKWKTMKLLSLACPREDDKSPEIFTTPCSGYENLTLDHSNMKQKCWQLNREVRSPVFYNQVAFWYRVCCTAISETVLFVLVIISVVSQIWLGIITFLLFLVILFLSLVCPIIILFLLP
jgi:hypothetical protein